MEKPDRQASFTRTALFLCAGPLIWAAHFLVLYTFVGILCARPAFRAHWLVPNLAQWVISIGTIAALAAIGLPYLKKERRTEISRSSTGWLSAALALISSIAIVWEALPVFMVAPCG